MPKHRNTAGRPVFRRHTWSTTRTVFTSIVAGLTVMATLGFSTPTQGDLVAAYVDQNAQVLAAAPSPEVVPVIERGEFGATPGYETLIQGARTTTGRSSFCSWATSRSATAT